MLLIQEKCEKLIETFKTERSAEFWISKNGTINLGKDPEKPLFSYHSFYTPIKNDNLLPYLEQAYKLPFPQQLLSFYSFSNGADLFTAKVMSLVVADYFANPCLSIYGLSDRSPDGHPGDIRTEGLARGKKIPKEWLKCGHFSPLPFSDIYYDIFIDTTDEHIYMTKKRESVVIREFDSFDECYCSLFDELDQHDLSVIFPSPLLLQASQAETESQKLKILKKEVKKSLKRK